MMSDTSVEQELVASNPEPRNWKGIIISILVIGLVITLVALSVIWMTPPDPGPRVTGEKIRLDTILDGKFKPNAFNASWFQGSKLVFIDSSGGLSVLDHRSHALSQLMDNSTFRMLNSATYSLSPDLRYVMVVHDAKRVFRHSMTAKYTIQSLENSTIPPVSVGASTTSRQPGGQELLQHAEFTPEGGVIFVKDNNIYYMASPGQTATQLTSSGVPGLIYNGVADWLYEEEILGRSSATWVSGDGERVAFAQFNDSGVEEVVLREFGSYQGSGAPIPQRRLGGKSFRYPRAGGQNPFVRLFVRHLKTEGKGKSGDEDDDDLNVPVMPPQDVAQQDHYICDVKWLDTGSLAVLWMNRLQNTSYYSLCSPPEYQCHQIYAESVAERGGRGWLENRGLPIFSKSGKEMILIEPIRDGEAGFWPQLIHTRVSDQHSIPGSQLTQGRFEVTKMEGWDQEKQIVYYIATLPNLPGQRHLFSVQIKRLEEPRCLTCPGQQRFAKLSNGSLPNCLFSEVKMAPDFEAYIQHCLGPDIPSSHLFSLPSNTLLATLDTNQRLQDQVSVSSMPSYKQFSIPLPNSEYRARVKLTLPPVLREEEDFQFPLIVNIYGGPGTQAVSEQWGIGWDTYLASQRNFIVASIDVRGSGFQGDEFKHTVFRQLGSVEVRDTLHVIRELRKILSYVDASKVCVWGWSFGGYLTGLLLAEDGRQFEMNGERSVHCGIAVAPVTQWHFYDSAYTERYMGLPTPEGNWKGFTESSLIGKAEYIQDNSLLVVHGTGDDNVHVEHSMLLAKALVSHQIIFRQQIYPDEAHSLSGVIKHEHRTMEAFLDDTFGPIEDFFEDDYLRAAVELLQKVERTAR